MQNFTLDLSQMTVVPDPSKGTIVTAGPRQQRSSLQRSVIETALEFGKPFNPDLGGALDVLGISKKAPTVKVVPSSTVAMASKRTGDLTVGLGVTGTVAMAFGLSTTGGFYGSTTPEFGVFWGGGFVAGIISGASVGPEVTFVIGTPADFAGPFVAFQASVGPVFKTWSVGGSLLFSPGPPGSMGRVPLTFMGVAFNATVGISALPGSISVEWSITGTLPLLK